jgi:hypothetical protein
MGNKYRLFDSGATSTILGKRFSYLKREGSKTQAQTFNNNAIKLFKTKKVLIFLNTNEQEIDADVLEDPNIDLILGSDWLNKNVTNISYNNHVRELNRTEFVSTEKTSADKQELLRLFPTFFDRTRSLPRRRSTDAKIRVKGFIINFKRYPLRKTTKDKDAILPEYLNKNLKLGIIRFFDSEILSPILFVKKKDGGMRLKRRFQRIKFPYLH